MDHKCVKSNLGSPLTSCKLPPAETRTENELTADHQNEIEKPKERKGPLRRIASKLLEIAKEKDPPHKIALGLALGIFIGFLPIMGIQMATVSILAIPLRANLKAALVGVWISNPFTFIPLYYANYLFGRLFVPSTAVTWEEFSGVISHASEWNWSALRDSLSNLIDMGTDILVPLWVGSAILGVVFGVPTYILTFRFVVRHRAKRAQKARQTHPYRTGVKK